MKSFPSSHAWLFLVFVVCVVFIFCVFWSSIVFPPAMPGCEAEQGVWVGAGALLQHHRGIEYEIQHDRGNK